MSHKALYTPKYTKIIIKTQPHIQMLGSDSIFY